MKRFVYSVLVILFGVIFGLVGCDADATDSEESSESSAAPQTEYYHIIFHRNFGENDVTVDVAVPIDGTRFIIPDCTDDRIDFEIPPIKLFDCWCTEPSIFEGDVLNIGDRYRKPKTVKVGQFVDLYAIWKKAPPIHYTIVFNANGGSGSMSPQSMTYDVSASLSANTFTKPQNIFIGWNTNPNGSGTSYNDEQTVSNLTVVNGDEVMLYAQWDIMENIFFDGVEYRKTGMTVVLNEATPITCYGSVGVFMASRGSSVTIPAYSIGKYEVTQQLYAAIMGSNPSGFKSNILCSDGKVTETNVLLRPVEQVTWYRAIVFCNKLSTKMGMSDQRCYKLKNGSYPEDYGSIPSGNNEQWDGMICDWTKTGYRLPTSCEWECAARGGVYSTETPWRYTYSGSNDPNEVAWYYDDSSSDNLGRHTWEVGLKTANTLGLYDMSGNVIEWCWDNYNSDDDTVKSGTPWTGSESNSSNDYFRYQHGGNMNCTSTYIKASFRQAWNCRPYRNDAGLGFRLAQTIKQ